jgi:hypothetical protein
MAAILAGTMRAPLTALVFAMELTGRHAVALPLLAACVVAHGFTVLVLRRSILTEKVARRGFHVSREYAIDPLEILFVRDVMAPLAPEDEAAPPCVVAGPDEPLRVVVHRMAETGSTRLPVVVGAADGAAGTGAPPPIGVITLDGMLKARVRHLEEERRRERMIPLSDVIPFGRFVARRAPRP